MKYNRNWRIAVPANRCLPPVIYSDVLSTRHNKLLSRVIRITCVTEKSCGNLHLEQYYINAAIGTVIKWYLPCKGHI